MVSSAASPDRGQPRPGMSRLATRFAANAGMAPGAPLPGAVGRSARNFRTMVGASTLVRLENLSRDNTLQRYRDRTAALRDIVRPPRDYWALPAPVEDVVTGDRAFDRLLALRRSRLNAVARPVVAPPSGLPTVLVRRSTKAAGPDSAPAGLARRVRPVPLRVTSNPAHSGRRGDDTLRSVGAGGTEAGTQSAGDAVLFAARAAARGRRSAPTPTPSRSVDRVRRPSGDDDDHRPPAPAFVRTQRSEPVTAPRPGPDPATFARSAPAGRSAAAPTQRPVPPSVDQQRSDRVPLDPRAAIVEPIGPAAGPMATTQVGAVVADEQVRWPLAPRLAPEQRSGGSVPGPRTVAPPVSSGAGRRERAGGTLLRNAAAPGDASAPETGSFQVGPDGVIPAPIASTAVGLPALQAAAVSVTAAAPRSGPGAAAVAPVYLGQQSWPGMWPVVGLERPFAGSVAALPVGLGVLHVAGEALRSPRQGAVGAAETGVVPEATTATGWPKTSTRSARAATVGSLIARVVTAGTATAGSPNSRAAMVGAPPTGSPIARAAMVGAPTIGSPIARVVPSGAPIVGSPIARVVTSGAPIVGSPIARATTVGAVVFAKRSLGHQRVAKRAGGNCRVVSRACGHQRVAKRAGGR